MAGLIPREILDRISAANDIADVVGQYVTLIPKGGRLFGLCPFHNEKTPSFSVSPGKGFYYCFGCHEGGGVIRFLEKIEKIPFQEAARRLAEQAGISIPERGEDGEWQRRRETQERLRLIVEEAARFYYFALVEKSGSAARQYLKNRGIGTRISTQFGLGFASDSWDDLALHLVAKGHQEEDILQLGLASRSRQGRLFDSFRGRLMIPIIDRYKRLVAFGGRALGDKGAKYINSRESLLYNKSRHLFAFNLAKQSQADEIIVTEGYFDAIALHAAGFDQTVAVLGTALTREQAQLLRWHEKQVLLCFDDDEAGWRATERSLETLRERGIEARVIELTEEKDPDAFIRRFGRDRFQARLQTASDRLDFQLRRIRRQQKPGQDHAWITEATRLLAAEADPVVRELKAKELAKELNILPATLLQSIDIQRRRAGDKDRRSLREFAEVEKPSEPRPRPQDEASILLALAENNALLDDPELVLQAEDFSEAGFRSVVNPLLQLLATGKTVDVKTLIELVEEHHPEGEDATRILYENRLFENGHDQAQVRQIYERLLVQLRALRSEIRRYHLLQLRKRLEANGGVEEALNWFASEQAEDGKALRAFQNDREGLFAALNERISEASKEYNVWRNRRV